MEKMFKLMELIKGYSEIHTKGITKQEAEEMLERHQDRFPDSQWWIEPHSEEDDREDETRHYNENACDGWEDIYPIY